MDYSMMIYESTGSFKIHKQTSGQFYFLEEVYFWGSILNNMYKMLYMDYI